MYLPDTTLLKDLNWNITYNPALNTYDSFTTEKIENSTIIIIISKSIQEPKIIFFSDKNIQLSFPDPYFDIMYYYDLSVQQLKELLTQKVLLKE